MKKKKTILVVDDEPDILELISLYLIEMDYSVLKTQSGKDAIAILENNPDIACILLDMMMPGLSGLAVLKIIREKYCAEELPVIMVTALTHISEKNEAFSLGANDYIIKPFDSEEVSLRVGTHIRLADAVRNEKSLNQKLKAINEELSDFAYIVSHDLKAPLRAITSLADWISIDLEGCSDEGTISHLNLLKKRVKRMNNLIEGTLQYSRIGRSHTPVEEVDSGLLVDSVIQSLKPPSNIYLYRNGNFPVIRLERLRLTQIFLHLIENAIRFMDKTDGGEISVSSEIGKGSSFCFTLPIIISPEALGEK